MWGERIVWIGPVLWKVEPLQVCWARCEMPSCPLLATYMLIVVDGAPPRRIFICDGALMQIEEKNRR